MSTDENEANETTPSTFQAAKEQDVSQWRAQRKYQSNLKHYPIDKLTVVTHGNLIAQGWDRRHNLQDCHKIKTPRFQQGSALVIGKHDQWRMRKLALAKAGRKLDTTMQTRQQQNDQVQLQREEVGQRQEIISDETTATSTIQATANEPAQVPERDQKEQSDSHPAASTSTTISNLAPRAPRVRRQPVRKGRLQLQINGKMPAAPTRDTKKKCRSSLTKGTGALQNMRHRMKHPSQRAMEKPKVTRRPSLVQKMKLIMRMNSNPRTMAATTGVTTSSG